jgi:hypothetical protein
MNAKPLTTPHSDIEPANSFEVVLSNGYRVQIAANQQNPTESFDQLGRAILGEVFLHAMDEKSDFKEAFGAVREEITTLVDNLDYSGVRTALKTAILAHFIKAYNDVGKGLSTENRPRSKKG